MKILKNIISSAALLTLAFSYSPRADASIIASITCEDFGSGFLCQASPADFGIEESDFTYYWNSTVIQPRPNSSCINGPTEQSYCYESCFEGSFNGVGVIEVTVVEDATGNSDTASKAVNCGTGGGGGF